MESCQVHQAGTSGEQKITKVKKLYPWGTVIQSLKGMGTTLGETGLRKMHSCQFETRTQCHHHLDL